MTTGEKLSSISSVSDVSALEHLLNVVGGECISSTIIKSLKVTAVRNQHEVKLLKKDYNIERVQQLRKVVYEPSKQTIKRIESTKVARG